VQVVYSERYVSADLIALAGLEEVRLSERSLHDLPKWGLLALASTEGRAPRKGVGRFWTAEQAVVFHSQMRMRASRPTVGRGELALVPVFFWLYAGEEWVPLLQARRALATWGRWYRSVSRHRAVTNALRELERQPDVQYALKTGAMTRDELHAELTKLPAMTDIRGRAEFYGKLRGPLAERLNPEETRERIEAQEQAMQAMEAGINSLQWASDKQLRDVQRRYAQEIGQEAERRRAKDGDQATVEFLLRIELPASCANAFTRLGRLLQDEKEVGLAYRITRAGVPASLAMSHLFTRIAVAQDTTKTSLEAAAKARSRRATQRRRSARNRHRT
jgi:hypothetical protein